MKYFRLLQLLIHVLIGTVKVLIVFPLCAPETRRRMKQTWSRQLLSKLGIQFEVTGAVPTGPVLLVANHVSWLDIYLINSLIPVAFVSKAEVREWPLIGWLARHNDTLFLQRGSRGHAHQMNAEMARVMGEGCPVAIFPEGTTTEGDQMLHFHGALLQPALSVGATLVPVAIRYEEIERPGVPSPAAAYAGDTTMGECVMAIAATRGLVARLHVLPPLMGDDRKILAPAARAAIASALQIPLD